jgi:hypothetical protein
MTMTQNKNTQAKGFGLLINFNTYQLAKVTNITNNQILIKAITLSSFIVAIYFSWFLKKKRGYSSINCIAYASRKNHEHGIQKPRLYLTQMSD